MRTRWRTTEEIQKPSVCLRLSHMQMIAEKIHIPSENTALHYIYINPFMCRSITKSFW